MVFELAEMAGKTKRSVHVIWTRTQLRAPSLVRSAILPRLHDLKEVVRLGIHPSLPVTQLSGLRAGTPITVTFINVRYLAPYLKSLIFDSKPLETPVGTIPFWRCREIAGWNSGDLVFVEASRHLTLRLARFGGLVIPTGVRHILDISGDWSDVHSRFHKSIRYREKQWMEQFHYEFEVSHSEEDFKEFYYEMYLPLMNKRHGELSSPVTLDEAREYFEVGALHKVVRDGKWVAGSICHGQELEFIGRLNGVRDGDQRLVEEGAIFMTVLGSIRWAKDNGFKRVNFLSTEPFLNDGKFSHKSQWGTRVVVPSEFGRRIWLSLKRDTPAVQNLLELSPFIATDPRDNLYSVVFAGGDQAANTASLVKRYTYPGLSSTVIRPPACSQIPETRNISHAANRDLKSPALASHSKFDHGRISVLLPDVESQFGVFVTHCLGRRPDVDVHIMSTKRFTSARMSRYCRSFTFIPENITAENRLDLVEQTARKRHVNVLLPIDTDGISFAIDHRSAIEEFAALAPVPTREVFKIANDKWLTAQFLGENGVPAPPTTLVTVDREFEQRLRKIVFPALLKPTSSRGGEGISRFDSAERLLDHLARMGPGVSEGSYVVQPLLQGDTIAVDVLAQNGKVLATTMHTGTILDRDAYSSPGAFRYFKNDEFETVVRELVSALAWSGIGCLDTLFDTTDSTLKIIEINSRFWGSVRGGLVVGVNYPYLACLAALGIPFDPPRVTSGRYCHSVTAVREFAHGLRGRERTQRFALSETGLQFLLLDPLAEGVRIFRPEQSLWTKKKVVRTPC